MSVLERRAVFIRQLLPPRYSTLVVLFGPANCGTQTMLE